MTRTFSGSGGNNQKWKAQLKGAAWAFESVAEPKFYMAAPPGGTVFFT